ncbi:MAG: RidA family protein [Nanoarchaeota archaeon]
MSREVIKTNKAPTPGNYSQAIKIDIGNGWLIYTAGQTGNFPNILDENESVVEGGIGPQTKRALNNLEEVLNEAGAGLMHVIKTTVYLENLERDKSEFEKFYKKFFDIRGINNLPSRSTVGVSKIPLATEDTIIEIDAVAYLPK